MSRKDDEEFIDLCIAFFQGDNEKVVSHTYSGTYEKITNLIKEYRREVYQYSIRNNIPDSKSQKKRKEKIQNILTTAKSVIENKMFWNEDKQHYPRYLSKIKQNNDDIKIEYLAASTLYLLKGYCKYILQGDAIQKDRVMWVDKSTNDLLQAFYLANAVYLSLNHDVRRKLYSYNHKDKILIRLAWLLIFVDIFRGNIFYKIFDYKGAFESYCSGVTKHQKIRDNLLSSKSTCPVKNDTEKLTAMCFEFDQSILDNIGKLSQILNKTFVKVYNEKAKCYFQQGHFHEAFKWHLKSLSDILILSLCEKLKCNDRKKFTWMINFVNYMHCSLCKIISYMDNEKDQHILLKTEIIDLFKNNPGFEPSDFEYIITDQYKYIAADIFARIGFLLYTLKISTLGEGYQDHLNKTKKYKRSNDLPEYILTFGKTIWENKFDTSYTAYLRLLIGVRDGTLPFQDFNEPEKIFAALILERLTFKKNVEKNVSQDTIPYLDLGISSMVNINNIVTMPRMLSGYLMREGYEQRARAAKNNKKAAKKEEFRTNKLVVLRRWQSFNPKIPRPRYTQVLGGGYFLHWHGKGIVIDPGYNFIQNFYNEGFSMEDIDAVLVTHSHGDHDDELSTILTLMFEWNEHQKKGVEDYNDKKLDLFLNEGSYRKYSTWLYAPESIVRKIYMLQNNAWDRDTKKTTERSRASNYIIDLTNDDYHIKLEVVPAWHHEIIGKHMAIGVKFHLYERANRKSHPVILGITGDSNNYKFKDDNTIAEQYSDCHILVAHLGDIKMREIISKTRMIINSGPLFESLHKFNDANEFLSYMGLLDISFEAHEKEILLKMWNDVEKAQAEEASALDVITKKLTSLMMPYEYPYHLGLQGILNLLEAMMNDNGRKVVPKKLFIIGEYPEELGSYKQMVSRVLNNYIATQRKEEKLKCMTGDIGLHVKINDSKEKSLLVRCHKCNQNNELISKNKHYHSLNDIQETIVKRDNNGMVYLCHDLHALWPTGAPKSFLSFMPGKNWG